MRKWDESEDTMTLQYEVDFDETDYCLRVFQQFFTLCLYINCYVILYKVIFWQKQVYRPFCALTFSLNPAFKMQKLIKIQSLKFL